MSRRRGSGPVLGYASPSNELPAPPLAARRWLRWCLGRHPAADSITGDLHEDFHRIARRSGVAEARRWYRGQAARLALSFLFRRFTPATDRFRDQETSSMIEALSPKGLLADARYAASALRRDLGLVAFAALITGMGVAATTATFSVLNPLLIQPLPFEEPEGLVWIANDQDGGRSAVTSRTGNLRDLRERASSFESIAGYNAFFEQSTYTLLGEGEPERLAGVGVTDGFLEVLGVEPVLGRSFTEDEARRWDDAAVILSNSLWRQRFAADPDIVGSKLTINGAPSTVVGVLPRSFDFSSIFSPNSRVDLLTTFPVSDETDQWGNTLSMVGRLVPGATIEAARAEVGDILDRLRQEEPDRWGLGARLTPLQEQISGGHRAALLLLFGAAGAVMLIVCVNLSSLLLSKGLNRRREMFLRTAMGAPRGRLLRQMLMESLGLSACGALLGVGMAVAITRAISGSSAVAIPRLGDVRVDGWALVFSCAVATLAGLAVGLLPALQASGAGSAGELRGAGRSVSGGQRTRWVRETLVVAEVALACVLLVVGGLMLQSFARVLEADLGFEPEQRYAWLVNTDREFDTSQARTAFFRSMAEEVASVPGVTSVGLTDAIPLGINRQWGVSVPGRAVEPDQTLSVYPHIVDRHYLETMGISLVSGRLFQSSDSADSPWVGIVNETLARELYPGGEAVGRALALWGSEVRIVGVVDDVRHLALEQGSGMELYLPFAQSSAWGTLDLVVRSEFPLEAVREPVSAAIHRLDPNVPTNDVRTLESVVDRAVSPRRFTLIVLVAFAATAVLLAALGIYGVLSYTVSERSLEIGIRMALGESARRVRGRVLGRTLALAGAGLALGLLAAIGASRLLVSLLYGVEPTNAVTLLATPVLLLVVAALAGWLPALRASRVDALASLRSS